MTTIPDKSFSEAYRADQMFRRGLPVSEIAWRLQVSPAEAHKLVNVGRALRLNEPVPYDDPRYNQEENDEHVDK